MREQVLAGGSLHGKFVHHPSTRAGDVQVGRPMMVHANDPNPGSQLHGGVQTLPPRQIRILGAPLDLGQSRRGVDMGPSAVRVAGLEARLESLGHVVSDGGNVGVAIAETRNAGEPNAKYLKEISETCEQVASMVLQALEDGDTPLILGGDHSAAVG